MNLEEKLYNLKGEYEAVDFALRELEKDSKIKNYLKLKAQKEKISALIGATILDKIKSLDEDKSLNKKTLGK